MANTSTDGSRGQSAPDRMTREGRPTRELRMRKLTNSLPHRVP